MSFLAPLYFLGALAIAGPIIFHLIRRQPKGEVEFSSLMFLDSTPPRLTRRSRLENWPLLLLRCAAILLLAFAFARPFLPLSESDSVAGVKQAVVLLIDQSASMQRAGLWDQAIKKANEIVKQTDDETLVSVIAFDSTPHTMLSLEESTTLVADARLGAAKDALDRIAPTWQTTDIGKAIRFAADQAALLELGTADGTAAMPNNPNASASIETRIVLLSDLQSGAAIETLQGYEWPDRVWLDVETLVASTRGNVNLRVLPQPSPAEQTDEKLADQSDLVRVQVSQAEDGNTSTFRLRFDGQEKDAAVIQVPPGETRFFNVKLPDLETTPNEPSETVTVPQTVSTATLNVIGDADDFDNAFHFIRPRRISQEVRFYESALKTLASSADSNVADARDTLAFYALQIPWSDSTRQVQCLASADVQSLTDVAREKTPLLIFNGSAMLADKTDWLEKYVAGGGRLFIVLDQPVDELTRDAIASLLGSPDLTIEESREDQTDETSFCLISSVDFKSSLLAPLSDPGVNDFSNIRIWRQRKVAGIGTDVRVTLKLDNGSPLLLSRDVSDDDVQTPQGKVWLLTTGWQPSESQFALSTKFVPILLGMLGPNRQLAPESLVVGDAIADDEIATVPGIVDRDDGSKLAVNLNSVESQTAPLDLDRLAEFGAIVSSPATREQDETAKRALRDIELESRQGWWQWLILATLGLIAAETLLAAKNHQSGEVEAR